MAAAAVLDLDFGHDLSPMKLLFASNLVLGRQIAPFLEFKTTAVAILDFSFRLYIGRQCGICVKFGLWIDIGHTSDNK